MPACKLRDREPIEYLEQAFGLGETAEAATPVAVDSEA